MGIARLLSFPFSKTGLILARFHRSDTLPAERDKSKKIVKEGALSVGEVLYIVEKEYILALGRASRNCLQCRKGNDTFE